MQAKQKARLYCREAHTSSTAQHQRLHFGCPVGRSQNNHIGNFHWRLVAAGKRGGSANSLIDQGVDVLTCHVDSPKVVVETAERRGAFTCGYHASQAPLAPKGYLTGAEWNWLTAYMLHVKAAQENKPMINFLRGGLKDGFVAMSPYGQAAGAAARQNADAVKAKMMAGNFAIFKGPLQDNTGKTVIAAGTTQQQTDPALEGMNYLVAGVVGKL